MNELFQHWIMGLRGRFPLPGHPWRPLFWTLGLAVALLAGGPAADARQDRAPVDAVRAEALPWEARETLALIRRGGPFPYVRDGAVFANREERLPPAPRGTYREYTVRTPGSHDRGARRIVHSSSRGEFYYTADHYRSFRRILE
ncbi:MAG TPA: ribonuclease domain-containing protein [Burkholderiales bacterium]|nr:ribonuclease domain-containing protein [Burkholderiales bacterium]